MMKKLRQ
jgi:hypothetical protein